VCPQYYPLSGSEAATAPAAANATLERIAAAVGSAAADQAWAASYQQVEYCSVSLQNACSAGFTKWVAMIAFLDGMCLAFYTAAAMLQTTS
jgi:hypothetical protein